VPDRLRRGSVHHRLPGEHLAPVTIVRLQRSIRAVAAIGVLFATAACQELDDPFPPQSAMNVTVTHTGVTSQRFPLPNPQIAIWAIDEIAVHSLTNFDGTFEFLQASPCTYQLNALTPIPLSAACRTSGLSLTPGTSRTGTVRVSISSLELRAAARPDLGPEADPDGDGFPNDADNCPIVFNPDQDNVNQALESFFVGDACSQDNDDGDPTIPDQDMDGWRDAVDNCLWYPNPALGTEEAPLDQNRDGLGDACERIAPVILPGNGLTVECNVTFTPRASVVSGFRLDFGRPGVLVCDAAFTGCALSVSALKLELAGSTTLFDCAQAP
jgi:hypothetical protein